MKQLSLLPCLMLAFALIFSACTNEQAAREKAQKEQAEELEKSMEKLGDDLEKAGDELGENLGDAMKQLSKNFGAKDENGETVEPISHRELKKFMPEKFDGVERTDYEGQTSGAFGFKVSTSEATYKEGNKKMKMQIIDTGGFGMAMMSLASWSSIEVDKETSNGYERTVEFDGHKAFEKYNSRNQSGQLSMIIDNRFIVSYEFRNMEMDDVKRSAKRSDFEDLKDQ